MPKVASQLAGWDGNAAGDCGVWTLLSVFLEFASCVAFFEFYIVLHISYISNMYRRIISLASTDSNGDFEHLPSFEILSSFGLPGKYFWNPWNLTGKLLGGCEICWTVCVLDLCRHWLTSKRFQTCQDTLAILNWSWLSSCYSCRSNRTDDLPGVGADTSQHS